MKKLLIKLLFRLIEKNTITQLSVTEQTELRQELANAYKSGIFLKWMNEKEKSIFKLWKSGTQKDDNLLRGRLLEIETIRQELRTSHIEEEKRKSAETKRKQETE